MGGLDVTRARRVLAASACAAAVMFGNPAEAAAAVAAVAQPAPARSEIGVLMEADSPDEHSCTASVVHSDEGDLVMTAAHCIVGDGRDLVFVPQYHDGARPLGTWKVAAAYVDDSWVESQEPDADVAFLRIEPQERDGHSTRLEDVTGALTLATGRARTDGAAITVESYNNDDDAPIACSTRLIDDGQAPLFQCEGFSAGSSGSPWMHVVSKGGTATTQVLGVIGGTHQGGCTSEVSFSPAFEARLAVLYARATADGVGDVLPEPGDDGC